MKQLKVGPYSFRMAERDGTEIIFDQQRKRWVRLTPEEWVRQNFIQYLIREGGYPAGLLVVEKEFTYNKMKRRADIVAYDRSGKPVLIVECKSYEVEIVDNDVFDQITDYNRRFSVPYFIVTNGLRHLAFRINRETGRPEYMDFIPLFKDFQSEK